MHRHVLLVAFFVFAVAVFASDKDNNVVEFQPNPDDQGVKDVFIDGNNSTESPPKCESQAICYNDGECGEKGRCLGVFVGKCDCNACLSLLTCTDDSACGGLRHACDYKDRRCNCFQGYKENGFQLYIDALRDLCNVRDCNADTDTCFGLPCHSGRCICG